MAFLGLFRFADLIFIMMITFASFLAGGLLYVLSILCKSHIFTVLFRLVYVVNPVYFHQLNIHSSSSTCIPLHWLTYNVRGLPSIVIRIYIINANKFQDWINIPHLRKYVSYNHTVDKCPCTCMEHLLSSCLAVFYCG